MKKYEKWLLLLLMVLVLPSLLPDCSCAYSGQALYYENMRFEPNSFASRCFVSTVEWPEGQREMTLRIPDQVEGKRVTSLGGFVGSGGPCPFWVDIPGTQGYYLRDSLPEDAEVEQYHLTIILGKYIWEARLVDMDHYVHMGGNRYIQVLVTIDLGENRYFALQNGKLYRKADGQFVNGFCYGEE